MHSWFLYLFGWFLAGSNLRRRRCADALRCGARGSLLQMIPHVYFVTLLGGLLTANGAAHSWFARTFMKRLSVLSPLCILRQESMLNLANTSTIKYICGAGVSLYSTGGGTDRLQLTTFALKKLWVGFFRRYKHIDILWRSC